MIYFIHLYIRLLGDKICPIRKIPIFHYSYSAISYCCHSVTTHWLLVLVFILLITSILLLLVLILLTFIILILMIMISGLCCGLSWVSFCNIVALTKANLSYVHKCAARRQRIWLFIFSFFGAALYWSQDSLSLIHIWRCRRSTLCRSRWSPYH